MPKNIVVCCDGTGNEYGSNNTNVVKLYEAIVRDADQVAFYDPGVGTFSFLGRTLGRRVGRTLGKAFGAGLQQNIEDAYRFLMDRYEPGDRLYLFGFSRGAFTVRALAGMLNLCGLLQKGSLNLVPYASRIYNDRARHGMAPGFKRTYCHDCRPHFIGVWDTVGSMGWFWGRKFFDSTLNHDVKYGYHAVSIDEQRGLRGRGSVPADCPAARRPGSRPDWRSAAGRRPRRSWRAGRGTGRRTGSGRG